jgi:tetrahedral aminopeptidase
MRGLFQELTLASGPGGAEGSVRRIVRRELGEVVDEMRVDRMGNLFATLRGSNATSPVLMFTAHMDEIGLIVSNIEAFGGIRFAKLGWIDDRQLISRLVTVNTRQGQLTGVIGVPAASKLTADDRTRPTPFKKLYVDVGSFSRAETEKMGVRIGDLISFRGDFVELANNIVVTKSVDDRAGLYMLIEMMKRLRGTGHEATIVAVCLAQHEIGLRGAIPAAYSVNPDVSIHIDVTGHFLDDPPAGAMMGGGPVLRVMEDYGTLVGFGAQKGVIAHRDVVDLLIQCAESKDIPYQLQIKPDVIGDQVVIHTSREGVLSGYILIPARYIHTQHECLRWDDVEQVITLGTTFAASVTRDFVDRAVDLDRLA